nr:unnamed protein product [Digitaria exilis]
MLDLVPAEVDSTPAVLDFSAGKAQASMLIRGSLIGVADEVQQLHESRQLRRLLEGPAACELPVRLWPPAARKARGLLLVRYGS